MIPSTINKYDDGITYDSGYLYDTYLIANPFKAVYKVYDSTGNAFLGSLQGVVSDVSFYKSINGGLSEMIITLAENIDDYGQGSLINYNNVVKIYIRDKYNENVLAYQGYISAYNPFFNEQEEGVRITILPGTSKLKNDFYRSGDDLTVTKGMQDVSSIIRAVIDNYNVLNPASWIGYTAASLEDCGNRVSYVFDAKKHLESIEKMAEFLPAEWYWFLPADGNLKVKQKGSTVHTLMIGKDIVALDSHSNIETLRNKIIFWNSKESDDPEYLYNVYNNYNSQSVYEIKSEYLVDGRVLLQATADIMANSYLNNAKEPKQRIAARVSAKEYDILSIEPGDYVNIRNISVDSQTTFEDDLLVVRIDYTPEYALIELSEKQADLTVGAEKAQNEVLKRINTLENAIIDLPTYNLSIAGKEWITDIIFSASDYNTIAWSAGTLKFSDGQTRSINAGNTGNMGATTVIYFDDDVSSTVLQTSAIMGDAVGDNRVAICLGIPSSDITKNATVIPYKLGQGWEWGEADISDNAITAAKIDVAQLSAITADCGTITAGSISSVTITGGTIRTAATGQRVQMTGATNYIEFYDSSNNAVGAIGADVDGDNRYLALNMPDTQDVEMVRFFAQHTTGTSIIQRVVIKGYQTGIRVQNENTDAYRNSNNISSIQIFNTGTGVGFYYIGNSSYDSLPAFFHQAYSSSSNPVIHTTQDGVVSSHFRKLIDESNTGCTVWISDTTSPDGALSGQAGDICLNGDSGNIYRCTGTTSWTAM